MTPVQLSGERAARIVTRLAKQEHRLQKLREIAEFLKSLSSRPIKWRCSLRTAECLTPELLTAEEQSLLHQFNQQDGYRCSDLASLLQKAQTSKRLRRNTTLKIDAIKKLKSEGKSVCEIAKETNLGRPTIYKILKHYVEAS